MRDCCKRETRHYTHLIPISSNEQGKAARYRDHLTFYLEVKHRPFGLYAAFAGFIAATTPFNSAIVRCAASSTSSGSNPRNFLMSDAWAF